MSDTLPIRLVYRSRGIQLTLVSALAASGAWEKVGLDPGGDIPFIAKAADADPKLIGGEIDFIFGSHVTPYLRYDEGVPFVYLGQTVNCSDDVVVSSKPISDVADLRGMRIGDHLGTGHPHGNRTLFLDRAGLRDGDVTWVERGTAKPVDLVADGAADAVFLSPIDAHGATDRGLFVHVPPPLPMVLGTTVTTLWPTVARSPELCRRLLRALRLGIDFVKNDPEGMRAVMRDRVGPTLGISDPDVLDRLYRRNAGLLEGDLYPRADAVDNAYRLAVRQRPDIVERVKPWSLWDLHFLRELDAE